MIVDLKCDKKKTNILVRKEVSYFLYFGFYSCVEVCYYILHCGWCGFMVFNATFNNISVISWRSVLLVEKSEYQKNTTELPQVTDKLDHIVLYDSPWAGIELSTSVVIGPDCIGCCKSN
jgi:hypothetical protein